MQDFHFRPAIEADFEPILALSLRVMREHLERIGRFDPARRRARMRQHCDAGSLHIIERDGAAIGCLGLYPRDGQRELHSFFLDPELQGQGLTYLYDFGDHREHLVEVKREIPLLPGEEVPILLAGERRCPPEDVGSLTGFGEFLEAMADLHHPEHEGHDHVARRAVRPG